MSRLPSAMSHDFSQVPKADIPRSSFKRNHSHKTTLDFGQLIPLMVDEVLPGDTWSVNPQLFARLATPIAPLMDNAYLDVHAFFVPNRLVWDNWQKFMGERDNPNDSIDFMIPTVTPPTGGFTEGSLADYFGLPTKEDIEGVNALPFRGYQLIYDEWYRDQNLQDSTKPNTDDATQEGNDTNFPIRVRGKRHDYFTSCLPWPQKGDAVDLPLGTRAPVATDADLVSDVTGVYSTANSAFRDLRSDLSAVALGGNTPAEGDALYADLTSATAATINQLREAFQIQKLLEKDARGGTRYVEMLKAHYGVTSPDFRLQRPEFLGSMSAPLIVNPVAQTSSTDATTPQGNLSGIGTASLNKGGFSKSFTEHGYVFLLVSARADLHYQQGINKMWSRSQRFDYYFPSLAHLGEQAVLSKEIFADGSANDQDVFGYQERWAEYRYAQSKVSGLMRSNAAQPLDVWHLTQEFGTRPVLGDSFIKENPPIDRVIAVPSQPHLILDSYIKMNVARPMPTYSVPGLIDHF